MLTGAPPFANLQELELVSRVVLEGKRPPRPNNSKSLGITNEIWYLLELCWAKDAFARPAVNYVVGRLEVAAKCWTADATAFLLASEAGVQERMDTEYEKAQKTADELDKVCGYVSAQPD